MDPDQCARAKRAVAGGGGGGGVWGIPPGKYFLDVLRSILFVLGQLYNKKIKESTVEVQSDSPALRLGGCVRRIPKLKPGK